ncbi:MAG: FtsW/RodA/SpoVE family cell cycle protein [Anaerolineales bacterium]|nr:FtsW/RodA/SpoVE family cell cycle protein [Anaerolineales bacterium]
MSLERLPGESVEQGYEAGRRERQLLVPALLFVWLNALALVLATDGTIGWSILWAPAGWTLLILTAHYLLNRFLHYHDPYWLPIIGLLTGWGLVLIARLAVNFLWRQLLWLALSFAIMLALAILPRNLRLLRRYRYTWLFLGLILLAATLWLGVNPTRFGAELWLPLLPQISVYFQPSELLKLLLLIFLASYFEERGMLFRPERGAIAVIPYLAPIFLMWGFCIVLLIWQQDLGAATLFFFVFLALLYVASGDWRFLVGGFGLLLLASVIGYLAFSVVALRVDSWLNPWPAASGASFQIVQSLYALGAGGISGSGVGQGFPDYIPVVHSDFAFAAIAEEWGMIGALVVLLCFAILAHRGLRIAIQSRRPFRMYLVTGIVVLLSAQTLLITAGVTKLLPLTGVTLPFVSYGGSSLMMTGVMAGLVLHISTDQGQGSAGPWSNS